MDYVEMFFSGLCPPPTLAVYGRAERGEEEE